MRKQLLSIFFLLIALCSGSYAQNIKSTQLDYEVYMYSSHYWRGAILGDAPTIEPQIGLQTGNFNFSVWGASSLNNSYNEVDLIASYNVLPSLSITLYDYYNPVPEGENNYFNFSNKDLRHTLDWVVDFSDEKFPIELLGSVFLFGDKDSITGKEKYSTYIEPRYRLVLQNKEIRFFAGFTPFASYYASKAAFINVGVSISESFPLSSRFELPLEFSFFTNPTTKGAFFTISAGLANRNE